MKSSHLIHCGRGLGAAGLGLAAALAGCISPNPRPAFQDVAQAVQGRTGESVQWMIDDEAKRQIAQAVTDLLQKDLTAQSAVALALLNNRTLQAEFEEIGISQAELAQASRLRNPELLGMWRFPNQPPSLADVEYSVAVNFLDLLTLPARKNIAAQNLERTQLRVADEVLKLARDTASAFYVVQARQELTERWKVIVESNAAAATLANRQYQAGNIHTLTLHLQEAALTQARLELTQARAQTLASRERLNRLMGLSGAQLAWQIKDKLPPVPEQEWSLENVETLAVDHRLDLAAMRAQTAAIGDALKLKGYTRFTPGLTIGVNTQRQSDGQRITGPFVGLELPIFDQGQPALARLAAEYRQSQRQYEALEIHIRSEVRDALDALAASREAADFYVRELLPKRREILGETLLQYNAMQLSSYELLAAKEGAENAERGYIAALQEYWTARAELERAVGGQLSRLERSPATEGAPNPAASKISMDHPETQSPERTGL